MAEARDPDAADGTPREPHRPGTTGPVAGPGIATPLTGARLLGHLLLVAAGMLVGVAGVLVQAAFFPGGLLLALAGTAGCFHGGTRLTGTGTGALLPAGGWLLAVILLSASRPEGDFLLAPEPGSYVFLGGGALFAAVCAATAGARRR